MPKVCVVGGGATGAALLWSLAQDPSVRGQWQATLLHDQPSLGGHSLTKLVEYRGRRIPVDIGVQFISPMLYPNVQAMLDSAQFRNVRVSTFDSLKVACAFPRDPRTKTPRNWGNFPAYQQGSKFALFDTAMAADATGFQKFIELAPMLGWGSRTISDFVAHPPMESTDLRRFVDMLVSPYMSIMNGYGSADLSQVTFGDLWPLFGTIPWYPTPLASFTQPGTGWARFTDGSSTWVHEMADVAGRTLDTDIRLGATVTAVWTDMSTDAHPVHVVWRDDSGEHHAVFDKVVLTTDMWQCADLLDNANNATLWRDHYAPVVGRDTWPLLPGACYIHTDETILSPDLADQQETLQFTAWYANCEKPPYYALDRTYTTYILRNLLADQAADGLYLTMYGDTSRQPRLPRPETVRYQESWTHGRWAASFLGGPKRALHDAQGFGQFRYPRQVDTNVYFAGNNTTTDSEEGALDSAMAIANYAFGAAYPIEHAPPQALAMFLIFYFDVMFPMVPAHERMAAISGAHPLSRPRP